MTDGLPLRVAVIGAGPAGFYTTEALLKQNDSVFIDIFDRLPAPYGLVRYGVAPDHHRIKSIEKLLARTGRDERVRFFGNVEFGRDLDLEDLQRHYHALVFATGAPLDRNLGVPGEDLPGSLSATEFVAWYNGHPDYRHLEPDLSAEAVAVIGLGNVAVDVTRILAKSVDELRATDIAAHALEQLAESRVRDIWLIGRRGPAQARFTTKELRELGELDNADISVDAAQLELDPYSEMEVAGDMLVQRNLQVLAGFAAAPVQGKPRHIRLRFLRSPLALLGTEKVTGLELAHNELQGAPGLGLKAMPTDVRETLEAGLVLRSIGYRGTALPGVPFDERRAVIPHEQGRVRCPSGEGHAAGLYTTGWIKRGPSGVIGSNKADALETAACILADEPPVLSPEAAAPEAIEHLLERRGVRFIRFSDWEELDRLELSRGAALGRPRLKFTDTTEMLEALAQPA